jgi:hypothetical protein
VYESACVVRKLVIRVVCGRQTRTRGLASVADVLVQQIVSLFRTAPRHLTQDLQCTGYRVYTLFGHACERQQGTNSGCTVHIPKAGTRLQESRPVDIYQCVRGKKLSSRFLYKEWVMGCDCVYVGGAGCHSVCRHKSEY